MSSRLSITHHEYAELRERVMREAEGVPQRQMKVLGETGLNRALAQKVLDATLHELGIEVDWPVPTHPL